MAMRDINLKPIRRLVLDRTTVNISSIHGPEHWKRVEKNGVRIARNIGADELVVTLFALFHDSMRENDGYDPEHGPRAAAFARTVRSDLTFLNDDQMDTLCYACEWHTHEQHNTDLTIGACFDADRLDLGRVGIQPDPAYLNSDYARQLAVQSNRKRGIRGIFGK